MTPENGLTTRDMVQDFVGRRRWAVVGVSDDPTKFGRRIFEDLRAAGYDVVPVHPSLTVLDDGTPVSASISAISPPVDVVDLVIPPKAAPAVLRDVAAAGVTRVWFQPGAADDAAITLAAELGLQAIAFGPCAMVEKRRW